MNKDMRLESKSITELSQQIAKLSPADRAEFEQRLRGLWPAKIKEAIPRRAGGDSAPLSFAQTRLWFLDQYQPNSAHFNVPAALRLAGQLHVEALRSALSEVVKRHEVLRTTFMTIDGEPMQVIGPAAEMALPVFDLSDLLGSSRQAEVIRLTAEAANRPFDLKAGPVLRANLLRLEPAEHVLLLTFHHIVSDGWSTVLFWRELGALYQAFAAELPSLLAELPIQYADYSVWQRQWLADKRLDKQIEYWKQQLAGSPAVLRIADRPASAGRRKRFAVGNARGISKQSSLTNSRLLSRRKACTLFMTLAGGVSRFCLPLHGQDDIVVGTPIAGRNREPRPRTDRILRQHAGAAHRPFRQSDVSGAAAAGARGGAGSLRASGPAV